MASTKFHRRVSGGEKVACFLGILSICFPFPPTNTDSSVFEIVIGVPQDAPESSSVIDGDNLPENPCRETRAQPARSGMRVPAARSDPAPMRAPFNTTTPMPISTVFMTPHAA